MLFRGLSKKIDVYANINSFRFKSHNKSIIIDTYVYIKHEETRSKILSVGELPQDLVNAEKVNLFSGNSKLDKLDILIAFARYGTIKVTGKYTLINPTITCHGVSNFKKIFNGYESGIFNKIFESAGAIAVHIKQ